MNNKISDSQAVGLLLEAIKQIYVNMPRVCDVADYRWSKSIQDILDCDPDREYIDIDGANEEILSITKPVLRACPNPGKELSLWLKDGWENYSNEASLMEYIIDSGDKVYSRDNVALLKKFEIWKEHRSVWVEKQKRLARIINFYNILVSEFDYMRTNGDKEELVLSLGNLTVNMPLLDNIRHPIITQSAYIDYDVEENRIAIKLKDEAAEIEIDFLDCLADRVREVYPSNGDDSQYANLVNEKHFPDLINLLMNAEINYTDIKESEEFLEKAAHIISGYGTYNNGIVDLHNPNYKLIINAEPMLIRRDKVDGLAQFIDKIKRNLQAGDYIPPHFLSLVERYKCKKDEPDAEMSIDQKLQEMSAAYDDIFLTKPSNKEQLHILHKIEKSNSVVVQGPPGTGKTHSIANILGDIVAHGKNVLVVSEKTKALEVIRGQLVKELQPLCVPMINGNTKLFEIAIDTILENSGKSDRTIKNKIDGLQLERNKVIKDLLNARKNLFLLRCQQTKKVSFRNEKYSLIDMAKYVVDKKELLEYIPGAVERDDELPIAPKDLQRLLESNKHIEKYEELELDCDLPVIDSLMTSEAFSKICEEYRVITKRIKEIEGLLSLDGKISDVGEKLLCQSNVVFNKVNVDASSLLKAYVENMPELSDWFVKACMSKRQGSGSYRQWELFAKKIFERDKVYQETYYESLENDIEFVDGPKSVLPNLENLINKNNTGKFSWISKITGDVRAVSNNIKINGRAINSYEECILAKHRADYLILDLDVRRKWTKLFEGTSLASKADTDNNVFIKKTGEQIEIALNWLDREYNELLELAEKCGFKANVIHLSDECYQEDEFLEYYKRLKSEVPLWVELQALYSKVQKLDATIRNFSSVLDVVSLSQSSICSDMKISMEKYDDEVYKENLKDYKRLLDKKSVFIERRKLLNSIASIAPDWAAAIRDRAGVYSESVNDINFHEAWKAKQFECILKDVYSETEDSWNEKIKLLSQRHTELTIEICKFRAWYYNTKIVNSDGEMKNALNAVKTFARKIGAGTGKNAQKYLNDMKRNMAMCQKAVPIWVMTVSDALKRFDPGSNKFDYMIIDEASQSSLNVLVLTYLADKVIVVGDKEQVTPAPVGRDVDTINNILESKLSGVCKNYNLFRPDVSVYEIMSGASPTVALTEHFRCNPEIINYCNRLCYNNRIKPLKVVKSDDLAPSIINYNVNGKRSVNGKTNTIEALYIVALIQACIEQKEYKGKTIGIIPMLGDGQRNEIYRILCDKISAHERTARNIVCGEAPAFQGDERDIIFMSLVDDDNTIRLVKGDSYGGLYKQRYNVAVSRAREQLWIVNSLDKTLLREEDIRYGLLNYADHSKLYSDKVMGVENLSDSPFEEEVAKYLISKGYNIHQQYAVGPYRIDMVVTCGNKRIAVECDGEKYHSGEEKIREDMEREIILNRIGNWEFIRIRGGAYYRDKEGELKKLVDKLSEKNIFPEKVEMEVEDSNNEVLERVKSRVHEIYRQWTESKYEATLVDAIVESTGFKDDFGGINSTEDRVKYEAKPIPKPKPMPKQETTPTPKPKPMPKQELTPTPKPKQNPGLKLIKDKNSFVVGKKVWNKVFGDGVVVKVGLANITVQFKNHEEHFFANNAIKKEEYFEYE